MPAAVYPASVAVAGGITCCRAGRAVLKVPVAEQMGLQSKGDFRCQQPAANKTPKSQCRGRERGTSEARAREARWEGCPRHCRAWEAAARADVRRRVQLSRKGTAGQGKGRGHLDFRKEGRQAAHDDHAGGLAPGDGGGAMRSSPIPKLYTAAISTAVSPIP